VLKPQGREQADYAMRHAETRLDEALVFGWLCICGSCEFRSSSL
jgi:hypothetical protein